MIFGATTLARYGNIYNLSRWERRQMRSCLERLLTRACKLVNDAFPVEENRRDRFGSEYLWCTKKRANFDSHKDDWLTYLAIPHLKQDNRWPDRDETAEPAPVPTSTIVPGISTADTSNEWLQTLIQHFGDFTEDSSTAKETDEDSAAGDITEDDAISENLTAANTTARDITGDVTSGNVIVVGSTVGNNESDNAVAWDSPNYTNG